jgi:general stress protein YciG
MAKLKLKFCHKSPGTIMNLGWLSEQNCSIAKEIMMAESTARRGFASMSPEKQREIASKGGKSVPSEKRSFSQNRDLASEAGRKGGQVSGLNRH